MKVTAIRHESHRVDGRGVSRVFITYELGRGKPKTAMLLYDMFEDSSTFENATEARKHVTAADMLDEVARAYMTLVYHGWEG